MSNKSLKRLSAEEENQLLLLFAKADALQKASILSVIPSMPISGFSNFLGITPPEAQQFKASVGSYDQMSFGDAIRAFVGWKYNKLKTARVQKTLMNGEAIDSEEMQVLLAQFRAKQTQLEVIKLSEEVIRLRISNKKESENTIALDVLFPILSEAFSVINSQLRALGLFHPETIPKINDCIEELINLGHSLAKESKHDTETYLTEFATTEEELTEVIEELTAIGDAVREQQMIEAMERLAAKSASSEGES